MEQIKQFKLIIAVTIIVFFFLSFAGIALGAGNFQYILLEGIPGTGLIQGQPAPDFNQYILDIYNGMIVVIGVCALFMITLGGYMYITSAGNTAILGRAKSIIADAIIGLVLALLAYLIFYTINPTLVNPPGLSAPASVTAPSGGTGGAASTGSSNPFVFISSTDPKLAAIDAAENPARKFASVNGLRINAAACPTPTSTNCTDIRGVDLNLLRFAGKIGGGNGVITAGSETGVHNPNGDHPKGKAVDMRIDDTVKNNLITEMKNPANNLHQICSRDAALCQNCSQAACNSEPAGIVHVSIN